MSVANLALQFGDDDVKVSLPILSPKIVREFGGGEGGKMKRCFEVQYPKSFFKG